MKRQLSLAVFTFLVLSFVALAVPAFAHHGFQFEYDASKYVYITGVLTKVEWENPHIYFNVDSKMSAENPTVPDPSGKVTSWRFEGSSATLVQRSGTSREEFVGNIGKTVTVRACPGRGNLPKAAAELVTLPGNREIVVARKRYYGDNPTSDKDSDN
jgi:hypothetical protein